jgi:hypothetical protein
MLSCAKSAAMPKTPPEPTNLVLEQLRLMRADMNSRFDQMQQETNSRFDRLKRNSRMSSETCAA